MPASQSSSPRPAAALLERYRIFHSRNFDAAHAFLTSKNFRADFPRGASGELDLHINGAYLPSSYLGYMCYHRSVALKATPVRTDYWIQLPIQGHFSLRIGSLETSFDSTRAAVLSPMHENLMTMDAQCERITLSLQRDALVRQLTALLGRPLDAPLQLAPVMELDSEYGRRFAAYLRLAVDDLERSDFMPSNPLAASLHEQFLIAQLLLCHPHNYSAELHRGSKPLASRDVKRAIDFIEGNLHLPITLADIVAAAQAPGRTLLHHFRVYLDVSPMSYLRRARLRKVHEALVHAGPGETVSDIARRWGFDHPGRFAAEYLRRIGERPSTTLARSVTQR